MEPLPVAGAPTTSTAGRHGARDLDPQGVGGHGRGGPALPTCRRQLPEPDRLRPPTAHPGAPAAFGLGDRAGGGLAPWDRPSWPPRRRPWTIRRRWFPFHQLVITSVGLLPPAVPPATPAVVASGGPGIVGDSCGAPQSAVPGPTPVVLPPTRTSRWRHHGDQLRHGGRDRGGGDPDGHPVRTRRAPPPPRPARRGGTTQTKVTLRSGSSVALSLPPLPVAGGHLYELAVTVAVPPQANPAGASQTFLIQIST